ncbi:MAG: SCO4226 family nickel-binding protein [Deltaproteobacteria bacterium]|nr:SCO4226 family nickel-binding protein [Deltaproteobacteria bacterium]
MAIYMDVHSGMKGITAEQFKAAHEADLKAEKDEQGVHFIKAWADPKSGKVFCLSEGPSKEAVQRVHERAGHPANETYEVAYVVD